MAAVSTAGSPLRDAWGRAARLANRGTLAVALVFSTLIYAHKLIWLLTRPKGSLPRAFLDRRPALKRMALTPLISANWGAGKRLAVIQRHFALVAQIGGALAVMPDDYAELLNLGGIAMGLNVTLDAPHWLLREGLLALSLWDGGKRVYTLSFTLGHEDGLRVAYVGGCQGVRLDDDGALYRRLTKAAYGMRPRDLLIDVFRSLCRAIGVERILAVSDAARHHHSRYNRVWVRHDPVAGDYDDIWLDRGGVRRPDGFFGIAVEPTRRSPEEIAPKKRAMYAARYRMLARIDEAVRAAVAARPGFRPHPHTGEIGQPEATGIERDDGGGSASLPQRP